MKAYVLYIKLAEHTRIINWMLVSLYCMDLNFHGANGLGGYLPHGLGGYSPLLAKVLIVVQSADKVSEVISCGNA